ncbi:MAG: ATP-grasp domain-containing protein [Clostridiales bacterium]|nr:ATP-grasp domain-containing protein [Clostridiales bacterium]
MESLKGKKLLLMGGPSLTCDVVRKAHEMGVEVYVTDWYENSPAKKIADKSFMVSTADVDAVVDLARKEKVDGVYTQFTDSTLPYCAQVCEKLGFPFFLTLEQERTISCKNRSKHLCMQYDIPVSKEYEISSIEQADEMNFEWPVLTKPVDNSGQRGITICNNIEELKAGYEIAMENSETKTVVVEEYMKGDYIVLCFTIQNGELYLSTMADKPVIDEEHSNGMIRLPKGYIMPSKYIDLFYQKRFKNFEAMIKGLGIKNGNLGVECVVRNDDFYVFEMQFRMGGMRHQDFLLAETGIDTIAMHIRYALTGKFEGWDLSTLNTPYFKKVYCSLNILLNEGTISRISGVEEVKSLDGVISFLPMHQLGDKVELSGTVFQIFAKASLITQSKDELLNLIKQIMEIIVVEDQNGNDMKLESITVTDLK